MHESERIYKNWLLDCVLVQGWTTVKCARTIGAKPKDVLKDFEMYLAELPKFTRRLDKDWR